MAKQNCRNGTKAAKDFNYNPDNFREHGEAQRTALDSLLNEVGWVTGVIVNKTTNRLIDGHLRVEEGLKQSPEAQIPFTQVDLSEEEERKILLVLDPIGALATMDAENFQSLAESIDFNSKSLDELIAQLSENEQLESDNEPNLDDPDFSYENQFGVIVECDDEAHQKEVFDALTEQGYKVKVVVV